MGAGEFRHALAVDHSHGFFLLFSTASLPGGQCEKSVLCQNRPHILAQALGFSRAEVRGCELLRVTVRLFG